MLHCIWPLIQKGLINNLNLKCNKSCIGYRLLLLLILPILFLPITGYTQQTKQSAEITAFIKKQSLVMARRASDWAKDKTGDILLDGVKEFIKQNNLDQNTAGKILTAVADNKEDLQQIYEGVSSTDVQAAALSTQLLIGKIIAENVPESNMSAMLQALTKYPDVVAEASQAIGSIEGGDYYKFSETIGKIIWKRTAIGKGIDKAISLEKAGWDFLLQEQFDAAFQKYKENGSEGLIRMYSGPAAFVREKYFQGKSVSDDVINAKMVQLFEAALKVETAAQTEQVKLEHMYAMFKRMEMEGGLIFDFRKHQEQFGISKETDVFDRFLWLNRAIRRDLLSIGVDPWVLGNTLKSDNPTLSPDALALFMAFSGGGTSAYKAKFEEIARLHFPNLENKKVAVDTVNIFIRIEAPCDVHTVIDKSELANYYTPEEKGIAEMGLSSYSQTTPDVKSKKRGDPIQIKGRNFSGKLEINEKASWIEPKGLYDVTIEGTFSPDRMKIEELTVTYTFRKPSSSFKSDQKWNFTARNIHYKRETRDFIEYNVLLYKGDTVKSDFAFTKAAYIFTLSEDKTTSAGLQYHRSYRKDNFKITAASVNISLKFYKSPRIPTFTPPKSARN